MNMERPLHPDFRHYLELKDQSLIDLFNDLRSFVLKMYPDSNELLYHTHALTALFTVSEKMSDAFCMIPIYTKHLNLGFNKGTLLEDPHGLLQGTGKLIRHIPITRAKDFRNKKVEGLLGAAVDLAVEDLDKPSKLLGQTISKIKKV